LRIGIDGACLANERGYGRYAREILRLLPGLAPDDEFVCFLHAGAPAWPGGVPANVRQIRLKQRQAPTQAASADGRRSLMDMLRFTRAVAHERLDVFFSPSVYTYFPLPPGLPTVVTVHDAIAERFPELTLPTRRARLFWRSKVSLAVWQARIVLTVSDYSARELERVLRIPAARLRVTNEAPSAVYRPSDSAAEIGVVAARLGLPPGASWFVYVGGFNPHKRLDLIIRAHAALVAERGADAPYLILVGAADRDGFHKDIDSLHDEIVRAGTTKRVCWAGFVSDDDLRHLHSGALALILVSESEGFGLPAVEAAACGAPVVATLESPLPELLAGGGLFVPPGDAGALTEALRRMATDEVARRAMGVRAREQAARLDWRRSAQVVLAALREAGHGTGAAAVSGHSTSARAAPPAGRNAR
jgi:glycosyltransferase involved in cell wall biosynthesis